MNAPAKNINAAEIVRTLLLWQRQKIQKLLWKIVVAVGMRR